MSGKTKNPKTRRVTSADGTVIAYEESGQGPVVILVDGAFCSRAMGPMEKLAARLDDRFRVFRYDRRGRNESTDTAPYAVERELDDLEALLAVAGGSALLYGASSGAALAMRFAASRAGVRKLAMYEPPFVLAGSPEPVQPDSKAEITEMVHQGKRDDATKTFLRMVGVPAFGVFMMRFIPGVWSKLAAASHTLPYDFAVLGDTGAGKPLPDDLVQAMRDVKVPTWLGVGGKSPGYMKYTADAVASRIEGAVLRTLEGQTHVVSEKAIAPVLAEFFST